MSFADVEPVLKTADVLKLSLLPLMPAICRTVPFVFVMKRALGFCNQALQTITLQKCVMWRARLGLYQPGCFSFCIKEC